MRIANVKTKNKNIGTNTNARINLLSNFKCINI